MKEKPQSGQYFCLQTSSHTLYSSRLRSLAQTAIAITHARRETQHLPVHPDDRLKERAFGSLEGRSYKGGKRDSIPGIEQSSALAERLADFWRDLVTEHAREETTKETTTACIVAHGASLSSLLGCLTEYSALEEGVKPSRLWNCSVTELLVPLSAQSSSSSSSAAEVQASHLLDDVKALEDAKVQGDEAAIVKAQLARDEAYRTRAKSAGIVIVRWADVTHLEDEPIGAPRAKGAPEASATKTGVSKVANADEVNA